MIIIIRGACGIGKTAVSQVLAELIYKAAHIEADQLVYMSDKTMEEVWEQQKHEGFLFLSIWAAAVASALVEHGFHPIIDWMYPVDGHLQDLIRRLRHLEQQIHVFNLLVNPEEHLKREEKRLGGTGREAVEMVEYFRENNSWANSPIGTAIDTTGQTPEDVARKICRKLGSAIEC